MVTAMSHATSATVCRNSMCSGTFMGLPGLSAHSHLTSQNHLPQLLMCHF